MHRLFFPTLFLTACPNPLPSCTDNTECATTSFCVEGDFCLPVFDRTYTVTILEATAPELPPTGSSWDPEDGSAPDLYALWGSPDASAFVCTSDTFPDTFTAPLNSSCDLTLRSGQGFAIQINDLDSSGQAEFVGGWLWEDDQAVVELVRNYGQELYLEDRGFSTLFRVDPP